MKNLIIASTSTIYGSEYLEYILPELEILFANISEILFIPYARPSGISHEEYTEKVNEAFAKMNKTVVSITTFENQKEAIKNAKGIFVGGGNTFVLLHRLYQNQVMDVLEKAIKNGTPYLGTSAGSNICGLTIGTTNDMPIVYPRSFVALQILPFNINAHYLDPIPNSTHKGETRETRIKEFHVYNPQAVLGLREGSWLQIIGEKITLKGNLTARLFLQNKITTEMNPETLFYQL